MVKVKENLTGRIFGRWTVLKQAEDYVTSNGKHLAQWLCQCNCKDHTVKAIRQDSLKNGTSLSCGCLQKEAVIATKTKLNEYKLLDDYGILWSTNTNEEIYFDLDDAEKILKHTWHIDNRGYPVTSINKKPMSMHVFLGLKWYDHEDRNKLNNRNNNLRPCTAQENNRNHSIHCDNKSGFIGVMWDEQRNKWVAYIIVNRKWKNLGRYNNKLDAIKARLFAEAELFGEFAPQRHLFEEYEIKNNLKEDESNVQ